MRVPQADPARGLQDGGREHAEQVGAIGPPAFVLLSHWRELWKWTTPEGLAR